MAAATDPQILVNHIGYDSRSPKKAVIKDGRRCASPATSESTLQYRVVETGSGKPAFKGEARFIGPVAHWKDWLFWALDFSALSVPGLYRVEIPAAAGPSTRSAPFEIAGDLLLHTTVPAVLRYFRAQRCTGIWEEADHDIGFVGPRSDRVDVHGGWYDASGDISKYLSHLSYANYLNPQQTPMAVWNFLEARDGLGRKAGASTAPRASALQSLRTELLQEALHGADFLLRMQDPAGYFYVTVFDGWSKDPEQRQICSFRTQAGDKYDDYQAGYRQGGGLAIAALARMSTLGAAGCFGPEEYLAAALRGFHHLEEHNREYLDDGRENIIDDYCALLAATELYNSVGIHGIGDQDLLLEAARRRAARLCGRLSTDGRFQGWWSADDEGVRPYYHAAEAGLPVISLLRYSALEPDGPRREQVLAAARASLLFELTITAEVANPFGYARQYVRSLGGPKRSAFFIPHANESGYWWQGEDARLASLAAAARMVRSHFSDLPAVDSTDLTGRLGAYAQDQLNWILGLNPYDTCMLHGFGRNNREYEAAFPNAVGGIYNGITAGFADEEDIDFLPDPYAGHGDHRWRWSEQWIPHAAWYLLAVCAG